MQDKKYNTPHALLMAINDRLQTISKNEKIAVNRLRRHLAFDRLLIRLFNIKKYPWVLKGGYAMELRMQSARATKDIDLAMFEHLISSKDSKKRSSAIHDLLVSVASLNLNDFFIFEISQASMQLIGPPEGGMRFPVNSILDGKTFARFHIDIGVGDTKIKPLEKLKGRNWLGFAGIKTIPFPTISKEQQFAEKIHAYTMSGQNNSRVKDLVDMILLIQKSKMSKSKIKESIIAVFKSHDTTEIPKLSPPSPSWSAPFSKLAKECGMKIKIDEAFRKLDSFYSKLKITAS